jgi:hypothetical protein
LATELHEAARDTRLRLRLHGLALGGLRANPVDHQRYRPLRLLARFSHRARATLGVERVTGIAGDGILQGHCDQDLVDGGLGISRPPFAHTHEPCRRKPRK